MSKLVVEVWSDVVCPSCRIGINQLQNAIANNKTEDKIEIVLRSFQLDSKFPKNQSMFLLDHLTEVKGYVMSVVKQICSNLNPVRSNLNINYWFEDALIYNVLEAHHLIHWAKSICKVKQLEKKLFHLYFCKSIDLSKRENPLVACQTVELNINEAKKVPESNEFINDVKDDINMAKMRGVKGSSYFLVDQKTSLSGYQQEGQFQQISQGALNSLKTESNNNRSTYSVDNIYD